MEQAKARNPNIKLYGLAWGAPGWIGGGNFWSTDTINYLVSWLDCAKPHNLTIDYLGGWNETRLQRRLVRAAAQCAERQRLRQRQDRRGRLGLVGGQRRRRRTRRSPRPSSIIGTHYPCGYRSSQSNCSVPSAATSSGKTLWASENGSDDYNAGANAMARGINRGYIDGKMTAYINWPVVAAITPNLPWPTMGLALAAAAVVRLLLDRQERLGDGADHAVHRARLAVPGHLQRLHRRQPQQRQLRDAQVHQQHRLQHGHRDHGRRRRRRR